MALVCPVDHPPGVGTTFCRICGRTYVVVEDPVAPPVEVEAAVAVQAEPEFALAAAAPVVPQAVAVGPPIPFTPPPLPTLDWPAPQLEVASHVGLASQAAQVQMVPVVGPGGVQVNLPLVPAQGGPSDSDSVLLPETPADPAPELDDAPGKVRRQLDRTAVLAGFLAGGVAGAAVMHFLG
jgi:hypothetical protein